MIAEKFSDEYRVIINTTHLIIYEYIGRGGSPKHYVEIKVNEDTGKVEYLE